MSSRNENQRYRALAAQVAAFLLFLFGAVGGVAAETNEAPGVIVAEREATISSALAAQVVELPFKAGDSFKRGDRLVTFDCSRHHAELKEARAALGAAAARHRVNRELDKYGAIGKGEVRATGAETGAAAARAEALGELVKLCAIDAPFSGRVMELAAHPFETLREGEPLITIIDDSELSIEIIAPSNWLRWMRVGGSMRFEVRETGDLLDAEIVRLGAAVDPVSQSIDVVARIMERPDFVLPGMSGRAVMEIE